MGSLVMMDSLVIGISGSRVSPRRTTSLPWYGLSGPCSIGQT